MLRLAPNVVTARPMAVQSARLPSRRTKDWTRLAEERTGGSGASRIGKLPFTAPEPYDRPPTLVCHRSAGQAIQKADIKHRNSRDLVDASVPNHKLVISCR
jgi:hypothetical protein